jgi:hypothetical protein
LEADKESLELKSSFPNFMIAIDKLQRYSTWLLGQTAFRMIRVTKQKDNSDAKLSEKKRQNMLNIQESGLLSGGIETRHLATVLSKSC